MRCELSLQPLSAIQPFPESRPLLEAVQAGSNVWDEGAKPTTPLTGFIASDLDERGEPLRARRRRSGS